MPIWARTLDAHIGACVLLTHLLSAQFPDVVVPYEPFPGSIGVLPGPSSIEYKLQHHANETVLNGTRPVPVLW